MSHRPAQQTIEEERAALILELATLTAASMETTGRFPQTILDLKLYDNGAINVNELDNDDIQYLCERVRAGF